MAAASGAEGMRWHRVAGVLAGILGDVLEESFNVGWLLSMGCLW